MRQVRAIRCEVYSRVVGYYRPVQNWNKGKQAEYAQRKPHHAGDVADAIRDITADLQRASESGQATLALDALEAALAPRKIVVHYSASDVGDVFA